MSEFLLIRVWSRFLKTPYKILYQNCSSISCIDSGVVGFYLMVIGAVSISNLVFGAVCLPKPNISTAAMLRTEGLSL